MRAIYLLFTILFACFLISSSKGRAGTAGEGNTGAPGDNIKQCSSCHQGASFDTEAEILVLNSESISIDQYIPGEEYTVQLTVNANGASVYGFQMVSLFDSNNEDTEGFTQAGSGMQLVPLNGRNYLEHSDPSVSNVFQTTWIAPEAGSNDVSFYAAVNAANGNGNTLGDHAGATELTLSEFISSSEEVYADQISIYPNPVTNFVSIETGDLNIEAISIYNLQGQEIITMEGSNSQIDVSNLSTGLFLVSFATRNGERIQKKLMKK